jgi:hypothetical protein
MGGLAGSWSGESGPVDKSDTGFGWSIGGGFHVTRFFAAVGNYAIMQIRAPQSTRYNLEQAELGVRVRFGGRQSLTQFYLDGGGATRRARRPSSDVFGSSAPAGTGPTVEVSGLAGWFGPGMQIYFGRRIGLDGAVAWAWGDLTTAHVQGEDVDLDTPIGITTLRLRVALVAAVF